MKFAIACDPAGVPLKEPIKETLKELGIETVDFGINEGDPRDYPIFAVRAANAFISGECDRGIILCGTGVGISIAANKVKGIRCGLCTSVEMAHLTKEHNNANILALGGRTTEPELACAITGKSPTDPVEKEDVLRLAMDVRGGRKCVLPDMHYQVIINKADTALQVEEALDMAHSMIAAGISRVHVTSGLKAMTL